LLASLLGNSSQFVLGVDIDVWLSHLLLGGFVEDTSLDCDDVLCGVYNFYDMLALLREFGADEAEHTRSMSLSHRDEGKAARQLSLPTHMSCTLPLTIGLPQVCVRHKF
jgi:hypothetical protein